MVVTLQQAIANYEEYASRFGLVTTPLVDLSRLSCNPNVRIFAKDESQNLTGSVKARAALYNLVSTFDARIDRRKYLDASSGNYAKALVYFTHLLNYPCTIFVPDSFSGNITEFMAQQDISSTIFSEDIQNSDDARKRASQYATEHPELVYLDQYSNDGSWLCHYHFTAEEIVSQLNEMGLTPSHFLSGIGSGGTLIGVGKSLKEKYKSEIIGLESKLPHTIRGIRHLDNENAPQVYLNQKSVVSRLQCVDISEVMRYKDIHHLDYGISACANILASAELSKSLESGVIVTILPDRGS